ncbi:MAG: glycosyltransferase family 39 protein [Solirubrobacterales bacterium]|nr:glycosyltransferase family 39 protein [Solirubrobacterales bacterium]
MSAPPFDGARGGLRALRAPVMPRVRALPVAITIPLALGGLLLASLLLRTTALHAPFWIDEGLSVGIASHSFSEIPGVLRLDGSPPLYYLTLHVWMAIFGDGQATTHVLSLGFALLAVPVAYWAAGGTFGRRAGFFAALLAAASPFLTYYAQETRMYALVALLALVVAAVHVRVFVFRRRAFLPLFSLSLAALMYTHNWGLFLAVGTVVALVPAWRFVADRRAFTKDVVLGYGGAGLLYAPWLPTLYFQAGHTGAPWSTRPSVADVFGPISSILGGETVPFALLLGAGAGLATIVKQRGAASTGVAPADVDDGVRRTAVWVLIVLPVAGLVVAWTASQISPAFTGRYFAVFVGPVILLAGIGLAHAGRLGLVTLVIICALWLDPRTDQIEAKSNVRTVAAKVSADVYPGDLIVSIHPEQVPVLHYYLPEGLRYADALGMVGDPLVFDWRDALERLRAAKPSRVLDSYVSSLRPGQTLVLVNPIIRTATWNAPWTSLVRRRSAQWQRLADRNPSLVRIGVQPRFGNRPLPRGVRATLYRKTAAPRDLAAERRARQALLATPEPR